MVQFPGSGSRHIKKTTKTHDSSNKNLKNWYCSLLQNACEGQPSKDVEKTPLSQNGSCQYLAIPKEKIKNPTWLPALYHGLATDVLYFWMKCHKDLFIFPISYLEKQFSVILQLVVVMHGLDCSYSLFSSWLETKG